MVSKFGTSARSQEDRRAQLLRAAAKRAALRHPHVLPARLVEGEGGRARLVLQPSKSPTLRAVLRRGPLTTKNGVALIVGLASAVEALAREGLVARELNPDSVLLHRSRGAILSDYGLPSAPIGETTARRDANVAYRSPEEREGRELTSRSSVYSLGAILVSALTAAQAPEQLRPQQARRTRDVPPTIESVIAQAMAAEPSRRYADVTEMARAAVDVVRASDRIGRMEAPAPQKEKPSREVAWRSAQHPATARLRAVAPLVKGNGAGPAPAPAGEREKTEAAQRTAARDAQQREKAEQAAQRKAAQDVERREKAEQAAQRKAAQDAQRREKAEQAAQRKTAQDAERREKAEQRAERKREQVAAKRKRDAAAKRTREQAAAKRKRDNVAKRKRDDAAKRNREEAAKRKSVTTAKRNAASTPPRRRGPTESGRKRSSRRGVTVESSAGPAATGAATARTTGSPRNLLARHKLPLLGLAIVAGAAGVSTLALTGGSGEAKAVRISEAGLSIRVPGGWEQVAPPAPRLDWLSGTLGAASSDGTGRGLVTGVIHEPEAAQRALRALLPAGASAKTVHLGRLEAERYSGLNFGSGLIGTAYVVHTTGPSIAMICRGGEAVLRQCAGAAATVTLRGEHPVPTAVAGRRARLVRAAVRTLSAERVAGRREVATAVVAADQAKASRGLQASYLQAAGRVDLSGAYGARIDALSAALHEASDSYGDLAKSIDAGDQRAYDAARAAVVQAETQVWGESVAN